ncbi:MAG TPA: helix-turn-helix transcriptional regulator [Bacillales bacterium]|nr:helix-turn-helix transcriptional regulator [Bacillales bacterium]
MTNQQGNIIRKVRALHHDTQAATAAKLNVSRGAVQQLETGRLNVSPALWRRFVEVYDVTPETIEWLRKFSAEGDGTNET